MYLYFILVGGNGATYVFNVQDNNTVDFSLKFYKARTIKQKILKSALKLFLKSLTLLNKASIYCVLKDKDKVSQFLYGLMNKTVDFELDENCSILISPTRDKVIVHHHGRYFHKFAFGQSYENVKNEAGIYKLLNKPFHYFEVSKFLDYVDSDNSCSFKLVRRSKSIRTDIDLTLALVELFIVSQQEGVLFSSYLESLKNRYLKSNIIRESIKKIFNQLEAAYENVQIPIGLVHRDFKPWNINDEQGLLIYDFEEAITDGPPLEDLLNYHIDPIVRYLPPLMVAENIFEKKHVNEYRRYLEALGINIDFQILLYCYLIERIIFWMNASDEKTSKQYSDLLVYIIMDFKHKH